MLFLEMGPHTYEISITDRDLMSRGVSEAKLLLRKHFMLIVTRVVEKNLSQCPEGVGFFY